MLRVRLPILVMVAMIALPAAGGRMQFRQEGPSWIYTTRGNFNDVRADLVDAIESRGLVVSYQAHTGSMLQRTADAVGALTSVYDYADTLLFCSAELTHKLLAANPHHVTLCPYSISVYVLKKEPGTVYLAIRAPVEGVPVYQEIQALLEGIIYDTVEW